MKKGILITAILLLCTVATIAQSSKGNNIKLNFGIKAGFQAVTYNHTEFSIEGYKFNDNTIQSNKISYTINPFLRISKSNFYLQTEAAFGITRHNYDFHETDVDGKETDITAEYNLTTYCFQIPMLIGYNFINYNDYGMSIFTGPRAKFIFTSLSNQKFSHFKHEELIEELDKIQYYWEFGLGVRIYNVFLDITYDWGLSTSKTNIINKETGSLYMSKRNNSILSFSAGFIF